MFRMPHAIGLTECTAFVLINTLPATAVDRFHVINFSGNWDLASNWSPVGVPAFNDRVFIDTAQQVTLDVHTASLNQLNVTNGSRLRNNGFLLSVDAGGNPVTEIEGIGSSIRVTPRTGAPADPGLDTNRLQVHDGGTLQMLGGLAHVEFNAFLGSTGSVVGHGLVEISNSSVLKLINGGVIRAEGGTLTIRSVDDGRFVLDGETGGANPTGRIEAIDGTSTLVIDGLLNNDFSGVATIGAGNTIEFITSWDTDVGRIDFNATGGIGRLAGTTLIHGGTMNVNGGVGRLDARPFFEVTSAVNLANGAALHLAAGAGITSGATFAGNGQLVNLLGSTILIYDNANIGVLLENHGRLINGTTSPGEFGAARFTQTSTGRLDVRVAEVTPGDYDVWTIQSNATLAGTLEANLLGGFTPVLGNSFTILETVFGNVSGAFDIEDMPVFNGLTFDVVYNPKSVVLEVVAAAPSADFDGDGDVDGADFAQWRGDFGANDDSDADGDGDSDGADFLAWQRQFGSPPAMPAADAVPEPMPELMATLAMLATLCERRAVRHRRSDDARAIG